MRTRNLNTAENVVSVYQSVTDFTNATTMPQGYVVVKDNEIPIDMFYKSKGADTTVVFFHGAVEKDVRLPWFSGAGVMKDVEANRLSISDPNLYLFEDLSIGWFAGSSQMPNLHQTLEVLIRQVVMMTGSKNLVFFGGSAGGFAALAMARHFPGSLALPMNPQTSIGKFYEIPATKYLNAAWPDANQFADVPDSAPHDIVDHADAAPEHTVAFIQNSRDAFHLAHHKDPFYNAFPRKDRLWTLWGSWGTRADDGHVVPPKDLTNKILQEVGGSRGRWGEALDVLGFTPEG